MSHLRRSGHPDLYLLHTNDRKRRLRVKSGLSDWDAPGSVTACGISISAQGARLCLHKYTETELASPCLPLRSLHDRHQPSLLAVSFIRSSGHFTFVEILSSSLAKSTPIYGDFQVAAAAAFQQRCWLRRPRCHQTRYSWWDRRNCSSVKFYLVRKTALTQGFLNRPCSILGMELLHQLVLFDGSL